MHYVDIEAGDLEIIAPALEILDRVGHDSDGGGVDYTVYAMTSDPGVLAAASDAVNEFYEGEEGHSEVSLSDVALAIPMTHGALAGLTGRGIPLKALDFAYQYGNEGIRTASFNWGRVGSVKVTTDAFTHIGLADGDSWLDDFYTAHRVQSAPQVTRSTEATEPDQPVAPTPAEPKMSSLQRILDTFLGG